MKKCIISVITIFCILAQSIGCFADDGYVEGALNNCVPFDESIIPDELDIDSLTTTSVNPWMKQYHLTTPEQALAGYYGGECGQKCFALAAAPTNPDIVLLGTDTETVWRSEDGGLSWIPSDEGLQVMGTHYICFHPDDENIAYVTSLANESGAPHRAQHGLYKSTDSGRSWYQVLEATYQPRTFSNGMVAFSDKKKDGTRDVYTCGNTGGVFISTDEGETWSSIGLTDKYIHCIEYFEGSVIACTKESGLLITRDDGKNWTEINEGFDTPEIRAVAVNPIDKKNWFAVSADYLWESKDAGNTWAVLNTPKGMGYSETHKLWRLNFSTVRSDGNARLYVTSSSVQRPMRYSDDYGKTFNKPISDNNLAIIRDNWGYSAEPYYVHPQNPDIMWISSDGQIMKSLDGGETLFPASSGYSGMRAANFYFGIDGDVNDFWIACIDRSSIMDAYTGNGEDYPLVYYMPNEDRYANLRTDGSKTSKALGFDPKNPQRVLDNRGGWGKGATIKESLDGGHNWHDIPGTYGCDTRFMAFNPDNPTTIYAGNFISYDDGVTWTTPEYKLYAMSPFNGNVVYGFANATLYKSTDEGRTFSVLCAGLPSSTQRISVDKFKEDKFYIGTTSSGLCIVDGDTFSLKNAKNGFHTVYGRVPVYTCAQDPENELHLVAGGVYARDNYNTSGIFESYDGGETWTHVPGVLNGADVWIIEFRPGKDQVWIGTSGGTYVYEFKKFFNPVDTLYTDIDASYARADIINLYNDGIYGEFTDGYFEPKGYTSRGEVSKQISKLLGLKRATDGKPYTDIIADNVSKGGYYYPYVQAMYDAGLYIISEDGAFNPDEPLTYDQLVILGARIMNINHIPDNFTLSDVNAYTDIPAYSRYAYYKCLANDVLDDMITFESGKPASNEDIAHFISNLKKILK